jgi:hypothetical protein
MDCCIDRYGETDDLEKLLSDVEVSPDFKGHGGNTALHMAAVGACNCIILQASSPVVLIGVCL